MTKYGGSWLKGFAKTFDPLGGINLGLQWKERKEAKKKLDDAIEKLKLDSLTLAAKYDSDRADGSITQQEYSDALAWGLTVGDEMMGRVEKLYGNYRQFTKEEIDKELGEIDSFYKLSTDLDFTNIEEMKSFGSNLTQEKAITKWNLIIKSIESRGKTTQPEAFRTAEEARTAYPKAKIKYTKEGYVAEFAEPGVPEVAGITDYNSAANYLSKFKDAPSETFNKIKTGFQSKFPNIDMSGITKESLREPEKPEAEPTPPAPTSTENVREAIKNSDTVEDARRINKNYIDKYGEGTLGIDDVDKYWVEGQIVYLDKIKQAINNLLVDRGDKGKWLKPGTVISDEVGLEFKGDQKSEDVYEMLRKEYKKYRDTLIKMGVDISQYPELLSLSELEKVGFSEGFFGIGIQRGQYKGIYK